MPVRLPFHSMAVLLLFSAGNPAFAETPGELPTGSGEAFRDRMMDWSAPEANAAPERAVPADTEELELPRLTSAFGLRRDPFTGASRRHAGIDIAAPHGTDILSAAAGRVFFAGRAGGYGNMVELDHGSGLRTRYAHLSRILVAPGTAVAEGQVIAEAGSTGRSTGSHLHFEVRQDGAPRNPLTYLGSPHRIAATDRPLRVPEPHLSAFARARAGLGSGGGGM